LQDAPRRGEKCLEKDNNARGVRERRRLFDRRTMEDLSYTGGRVFQNDPGSETKKET